MRKREKELKQLLQGRENKTMDNKTINEISEILQDIREDKDLDKLIESIEKIENLEVLNEEKLSLKLLKDPETKEAYEKLRVKLVKTLVDLYNLKTKNFGRFDSGIVDWLDRPDSKTRKNGSTFVKDTQELFDDYIFDSSQTRKMGF